LRIRFLGGGGEHGTVQARTIDGQRSNQTLGVCARDDCGLHGAWSNEAIDAHWARLANAVAAIGRLQIHLNGGKKPMEDALREYFKVAEK
jgi:hypothetical protein